MDETTNVHPAENRGRLDALAADLVSMVRSLRVEEQPGEPVGPQMRDTIYSKLLAKNVKVLPADEAEHVPVVRSFLESNLEVARWAREKLSSEEGRRNLLALLRIEMR